MLMLNAVLLSTFVAADDNVQVNVLAGTDFPISAGGKVQVELPYRLQVRISAGIYPEGYLAILNGVAEEAGWWDENTSSLINAALKNSLVTQASIGWRPWAHRRFRFGVGYQTIVLGGGLTDYETIEAVTGTSVDVMADQVASATVAAQLHQITAEVGWQWIIRDRWVVQATLGGLTTFTSQTDIEIDTEDIVGPGSAVIVSGLEALEQDGEAYLDGYFQQYVHLPTVGVYVGYHF